jgi:hypothetical protein
VRTSGSSLTAQSACLPAGHPTTRTDTRVFGPLDVSPTIAYIVGMTVGPSSVRFDPAVLSRLNAYVAAHPGTSISAASNRLVDEALRSQEHPLIVFRDGPAGRRARLVGGPDVWQVIRAVRSARQAEPRFGADKVLALVSDTTGVSTPLIQAAIAYWAAFPAEIDALSARADEEESQARQRWEREHGLLAR